MSRFGITLLHISQLAPSRERSPIRRPRPSIVVLSYRKVKSIPLDWTRCSGDGWMPNAKARKPIVVLQYIVIPSDDERRLAHLLPFAAFIARARESLQWHLATGWHPLATQFPFFAKNSKAFPKWHHCSTSCRHRLSMRLTHGKLANLTS